jgi:hypothetical protein
MLIAKQLQATTGHLEFFICPPRHHYITYHNPWRQKTKKRAPTRMRAMQIPRLTPHLFTNTPGISRTFALGFTVAISCNLTNTSRVTSSRLGARNPSNPSAMRAKQIINSSVTVDAATSTFTFRVNASKIPATSNNPPPAIINPKLLKGISPIINHLQIHRRGFCDCIAPNSK